DIDTLLQRGEALMHRAAGLGMTASSAAVRASILAPTHHSGHVPSPYGPSPVGYPGSMAYGSLHPQQHLQQQQQHNHHLAGYPAAAAQMHQAQAYPHYGAGLVQ
ncbi:unnamed protein product, partial [Polarella glacialis]